MKGRSIQHLDPRMANLDMPVTAAEFLETDVASARAIPHRERRSAVVPVHDLGLLVEVEVLNRFAVEHDFEARTLQQELVFVPLRRFVNLSARRNGAINSAG